MNFLLKAASQSFRSSIETKRPSPKRSTKMSVEQIRSERVDGEFTLKGIVDVCNAFKELMANDDSVFNAPSYRFGKQAGVELKMRPKECRKVFRGKRRLDNFCYSIAYILKTEQMTQSNESCLTEHYLIPAA